MFWSAHCLARSCSPSAKASALELILGCAPKNAPPAQGLFAPLHLPRTPTPPGALGMGLGTSWVACFLPVGNKSSATPVRSFIGGCHPHFLGAEMQRCSSGSISRCGLSSCKSRYKPCCRSRSWSPRAAPSPPPPRGSQPRSQGVSAVMALITVI